MTSPSEGTTGSSFSFALEDYRYYREFLADHARRWAIGRAGKRLRVLERGRPRRVLNRPEERARQGCLFQAVE